MNLVIADIKDDGVSAAATPENAGLADVVAEAKAEGHRPQDRGGRSQPADRHPAARYRHRGGGGVPGGSTVLVLSPTESGTFSTTYDRMTLEAGQDVAEGRGSVQGSKNFVGELTAQHFPWTTFTIVVVLAVIAAVVATRMLQNRAKRQNA